MSDIYINKLTLDLLLKTLTEEDQEIIRLCFIEGYTLHEIAKIIKKKYRSKVGPRTIGPRIHNIIQKLRKNAGVEGTYYIMRKKKRKPLRKIE